MLIRKKKIVNVGNYLTGLPPDVKFRPVIEMDDRKMLRLVQLGFPEMPVNGDVVLPAPYGPVSRFNAEGRWEVHRDKPKEERYIRTVSWRWKEWRGRGSYEEREEFRDIYRACYPRSLIPPPGIELTYLEHNGRKLLVGPTLMNEPVAYPDIRHAVNLLLEFGSECELIKDDLSHFSKIETRHVRWRMLPPGAHVLPP